MPDLSRRICDYPSEPLVAHCTLCPRKTNAQAAAAEEYGEAQGLQARIERLRAKHPLIWREERVAEAVQEENYALAAIFQKDLDAVTVMVELTRLRSLREHLRE